MIRGISPSRALRKKLYWQYSRADIKAPAMRIKEWDYYYVGTQDYGICLTVSDAAYVSRVSASILRYGKKPKQMNDSEIGAFPMGKLHMPLSSKIGDVHAKVGTAEMTFENDGKTRHLFRHIRKLLQHEKSRLNSILCFRIFRPKAWLSPRLLIRISIFIIIKK